ARADGPRPRTARRGRRRVSAVELSPSELLYDADGCAGPVRHAVGAKVHEAGDRGDDGGGGAARWEGGGGGAVLVRGGEEGVGPFFSERAVAVAVAVNVAVDVNVNVNVNV